MSPKCNNKRAHCLLDLGEEGLVRPSELRELLVVGGVQGLDPARVWLVLADLDRATLGARLRACGSG